MKFSFRENGVNPDEPLLYRIAIGAKLFYVGCALRADRPKKHYARNVKRMELDQPYRKNNPEGFRAIHHALLNATRKGEEIVIELLRNVPAAERFIEEQKEIGMHRKLHGRALLNATHAVKKRPANKALPAHP
jgi:hypothetical protein